jgi:hypothetical protein
MLRCSLTMSFQYRHVRAHQDKLKPWPRLSLEEQLNVICDKLVNGAVRQYLSYSSPVCRKLQLLPLEKAAVFTGTEKMMTDVGPEVCFHLGREDTLKFYMLSAVLVGGVNKGGVGWSRRRFEQVSWSTLELVLHSKPDMYQLWLYKQCIGICATRQNLARIQDILDNKCPNCGQAQETSTHLNRCPNNGHILLLEESITNLSTWMHQGSCTDPELSYWIEKYLLFHGTRSFTSLVDEGGFCSNDLCSAAAS